MLVYEGGLVSSLWPKRRGKQTAGEAGAPPPSPSATTATAATVPTLCRSLFVYRARVRGLCVAEW